MNRDQSMEVFSTFWYDIKRWKSKIRHFENEFLFIERQIGQMESLSMDMILLFKKRTKSKTMMLQEMKSQITIFENLLHDSAKDGRITVKIQEEHSILDQKFEKSQKELKEYIARVLRYS